MRKSHKILTAVAVAGIVFAGGSAFTGTGLTNTPVTEQFIGGEVSQTVTGATLANVEYNFADGDVVKTAATGVTLSFAEDLTDKIVEVTSLVGAVEGGSSCTINTDPTVFNCTFAAPVTGLTGLTISVDNAPVDPEV